MMHEYISGAFLGAAIASFIWGVLLLRTYRDS